MTRSRLLAVTLAALASAGCASKERPLDRIDVAPRSWPTAAVAAPSNPPRILAATLSSARVRPGDWWSGRIATTTNVASVELRSPSFSFLVARAAPGQFAFRFHILDLPTIYRRPYTVEIIARNSGGDATERAYRIDFR